MKLLAAILFLLIALLARGADYYVWARSGNTPGDGSDWTNARTNLPSTLTRGDTYYIAGGLYTAYDFNDAISGATAITIKKATVSAHGTDTGWHSTMATQAVFEASLTFVTSHWVFDGGSRGADWFDGTGYGFQIGSNSNVQIEQRDDFNVTNIVIAGTWLNARTTALSEVGDEGRRHLFAEEFDPDGFYPQWTISSNLFSGGNVGIHVRSAPSWIIQYNAFADNLNNEQNHGECLSAYWANCGDWIIRYNQVRDYIGTAAWAVNTSDNWQVYGNVYSDCEFGDGFLGFIGGSSDNHVIYNETVIRPQVYTRQISSGAGTVVKNCLFMMGALGTPTFTGCTVSFCGFSGSGTGTSQQTSIATSIFEDYAGGDYRLAENTDPGDSLASPFNLDALGNIRGGGGQDWSRGWLQFTVPSTSIWRVNTLIHNP